MRNRSFITVLLATLAFSVSAQVPTRLPFPRTDAPGTDQIANVTRLLLPVFLPPLHGAFGSEFRSEFRSTLANGEIAQIYGLARDCVVLCIEPPSDPHELTTEAPDLDWMQIAPTGAPGQFIYVPTNQKRRVAMNLRVYDTSQSAQNFGTELPIVSEEEFFGSEETIALMAIPSDAGFRNMLRIYGTGDAPFTPLNITIKGAGLRTDLNYTIQLPGSVDALHPAYAEFTDFPVNVGPLTVRIQQTFPRPIEGGSQLWAFVTVTNNETQHITTITPQP